MSKSKQTKSVKKHCNGKVSKSFTAGELYYHDLAIKHVAYQKVLDIVAITLHQKYGWADERQKRFNDDFTDIWTSLHDLIDYNEITGKDDATNASCKLEKLLQMACGQYYVPFEKRYYEIDEEKKVKLVDSR